jgi:hypothetical protein
MVIISGVGIFYFTNLAQSSSKVFPETFEGFGSIGCCSGETGCKVFVGAFGESRFKSEVEGSLESVCAGSWC